MKLRWLNNWLGCIFEYQCHFFWRWMDEEWTEGSSGLSMQQQGSTVETRQGSQEPGSLCVALAAFTTRLVWPELFVSWDPFVLLFFSLFAFHHSMFRSGKLSQRTDVFFQDSPWTNYGATESSDWPSCLKPSLRATAEEFPQLIRSVLIIISHGQELIHRIPSVKLFRILSTNKSLSNHEVQMKKMITNNYLTINLYLTSTINL